LPLQRGQFYRINKRLESSFYRSKFLRATNPDEFNRRYDHTWRNVVVSNRRGICISISEVEAFAGPAEVGNLKAFVDDHLSDHRTTGTHHYHLAGGRTKNHLSHTQRNTQPHTHTHTATTVQKRTNSLTFPEAAGSNKHMPHATVLIKLYKCHFLQYESILYYSFVRLLLRAGVQPTLDPSVDTFERSNALAQERGGQLVCA